MGSFVPVAALALLLSGLVAGAAGLNGWPFAWAGLALGALGTLWARRLPAWLPGSRTLLLGAELAVVLGLLGAADVLVQRHRARWDWTAGRLFTLAEPTRRVLRGLDRDVTIVDIHGTASPARHHARDLLSAVQVEAPRIRTQFIDPDLQPALARNFRGGDGAIVVRSGGLERVVRQVSERALTLAIYAVTRSDKPAVFVTQGHGEPGTDDRGPLGLTLLHDALVRESFRVEATPLTAATTVPALLIVPFGRSDLTPVSAGIIRSLWGRGASVLLLLEPGEDRPVTRELVSDWGLLWQAAKAEDLDSHLGGDPGTAVVSNYPPHPLTAGLGETLLPGATPIGFASEKAAGRWEPILALTESSRSKLPSGQAGPSGRLLVGLASERQAGATHGRRAVIGDTDFLSNGALAKFPVDRELATALANWLAEREDLLGAWPESKASFRLTLTDRHLRGLAAVTLLGMPCLLLLVALVRWMELRRS